MRKAADCFTGSGVELELFVLLLSALLSVTALSSSTI